MIFCFEIGAYSVYEGPPIGAIRKTFVVNNTRIKKEIAKDHNKHELLNSLLTNCGTQVKSGQFVLAKTCSSVAIVELTALPKQVQRKLSMRKSSAS